MFEHPDLHALQTINLLLLPGFDYFEPGLLVSGVDELNRAAECRLYEVRLLSMDGEAVESRQGRSLLVDGRFEPENPVWLLLVLAASLPRQIAGGDPVVAALARYGLHQTLVGASHSGVFWLAQAGLLEGCRATVHWSQLETLSERFPSLIATSNLFEIDRDRATCGGGMAALDMLLALAGRQLSVEVTSMVAEAMLLDRIRGREDRQRIPLRNRIGASQPKLVQAVMLMEANLEEPLTTDEIAQHVCLSRRQLERLFKQHLGQVPSQYYLELRLNRARQMLRQTSKSIIQIGLSCGFSSGPHFSSAYRNHFKVTPREDRHTQQPGGNPGPES